MDENYKIGSRDKPTFKWKIGVEEATAEIAIAKELISKLPPNSQLRLDANGGLTIEQAQTWLEFTEERHIEVEFIEQPLPPSQFTAMMALSKAYSTPLALDESVTNISALQDYYQRGWRGVFVIKCAIAGFPSRLLTFCQQNELDLVFSSVFETGIGRQTALQLASEIGSDRALGFGIDRWFDD